MYGYSTALDHSYHFNAFQIGLSKISLITSRTYSLSLMLSLLALQFCGDAFISMHSSLFPEEFLNPSTTTLSDEH